MRRAGATVHMAVLEGTTAVFMRQWPCLYTERLAIKTEIGYNYCMVVIQLIVVVTMVSVLYLYLRQSNLD
jgi:hypothetical protein